jgi:hypothetical protein
MDKADIYNKERQSIVDYISREIVGPCGGEAELLHSDMPTSRYLMGTLYPQNSSPDSIEQDEDETTPAPDANEIEDSPLSMMFQRLPASMGISFYAVNCESIEIDIWGGYYEKITKKNILEDGRLPEKKRILLPNALGKLPKWIRCSLGTEASPTTVTSKSDFNRSQIINIFEERAQVHIVWRKMGKGVLITATLLNSHVQNDLKLIDQEKCLFQVGMRCKPVDGTVHEYPTVNRLSYDEEEEELALQYSANINFAIGHGCAATWDKKNSSPEFVQTTSMPTYEVKPVTAKLEDGKEFGGDVLCLQDLANQKILSEELVAKLKNFLAGYIEWLNEVIDEVIDEKFHNARERIIARIENAVKRIRAGIDLLGNDKTVRLAFSMANSVMLRQMIHSGKEYSGSERERDQGQYSKPKYEAPDYKKYWRPFQLAYQLLVLESLVNTSSDDRDVVDLLWFPTGGGKTEAYLGLAAFELIYRRLIHGDAGAGTSVIKRYTLRLLTTQQFQRASTLICALELMRKDNTKLLGNEPYTLGLWVGETSSPNKYTSDSDYSKGAYELYKDILEDDRPENPFQLQRCPWCGTKIIPPGRTDDVGDYGVKATQVSFNFYCPSSDCELHEVIPVMVVDEDLYNHPPSFLIGTVDKFARLAWDHRASGMFGDIQGKYRPPSLIIQDELHLISGPLGTIAGIYEAAIDTLIESKGIPAKVIAATATIRRSSDQVKRLYGSDVRIFPPPGFSAHDSYFARVDNKAPGRLYVGVMGQGHSSMTTQVQTSAVLSQSVLENNKLSDLSIDTWWTQVIYHNSRRELGKTMTLARDDIPARVKVISSDEKKMRKLDNVEELSANVRGTKIPEILSRLEVSYEKKEKVIDILPCTNMISVGVDVSRLGLMLIVGQPKTTAEYIQASSRIGRDAERPPGLVFTLYRSAMPRDRSHYENFEAYHGALYRAVEPTSVTPYAPPSRDRALHAALVIVIRHACELGANEDAMLFDPENIKIKKFVKLMVKRMVRAEPAEKDNIEKHVNCLIEEWVNLVKRASSEGQPLRYHGKGGRQYSTLLRSFGEEGEGWPTLNSMRNVDIESLIRIKGEKS